jgi:hypothetical protein
MQKEKIIVAGLLVALGAVVASPASAASYSVGGKANGTSLITGPLKLNIVGNSVSCGSVKLTVSVTSGVAKITAMSFSPTGSCRDNTTNLSTTPPVVTWPISPPTNASSPPSNLVISNMIITFPAVGVACGLPGTGSLAGELTSTGTLTLSGKVGFCDLASTGAMVSNPVLKPVFP